MSAQHKTGFNELRNECERTILPVTCSCMSFHQPAFDNNLNPTDQNLHIFPPMRNCPFNHKEQ